MALKPAKLSFQFTGGVNTLADQKGIPVSQLIDLQNAVFIRETTLVKRNGYEALGTPITGARAFGVRGSELLVFSPTGTYSYRPSEDDLALTGNPISVVASERTIAKTSTEQSQADAATSGDLMGAAWVDSRGGIWYEVLVASTGRVLKPAAQLAATGTQPRCVACGANVLILWADHATGFLWGAAIQVLSPSSAAVPQMITDDLTLSNIGYDTCQTTLDTVVSGGTPPSPAAVAWVDRGGHVRVGYLANDGSLGGPTDNLPAIRDYNITVSNNTNIGVTWDATNGLATVSANNGAGTQTLHVWDPALTVELTISSISVTGIQRSVSPTWVGDGVWVIADDTAGAASERDSRLRAWSYTNIGIGTAIGGAFPVRGLSLASKAFTDDGIAYAYAVHDVPFFSVYLLVRLTDGAIVARTMPTIAHGTQVNGSSTWISSPSLDPRDDRKWRVALLYNEQLQALAGQFSETGIRWVELDFDHANAWQSVRLGAGLYLASAGPLHYDGDRWAEIGFHYAPDGTITSTPAASTGALTVGLYTYRIWYEETDAQGEIHRGPTSIGTAVTLTGGQNQVTLTGPMYRATSRRQVRVVIARAVVNDTTEFFQVTSHDPSTVGSANGYITNDPTIDTWTFIDRMSDATLEDQEPLYTTGGVISNDPAPMSGDVIAVGKNRILWTDPADHTVLRYSQQRAEGFAVEAPEPLKQRLDPYGGDITALAVMDDAIYPFRTTAIYVIGGPGPLADPTQQTDTYSFTPGQLVTSDVGCTSPRSIVSTPDGIAFKTSKGIRMLGRDRRLVDIGNPVRGFDAQDVTRATLLPNFSRVIWLTSAEAGSALHFDFDRQQWSRYTNHTGIDSAIVDLVYYYLRADGRIWRETPGVYVDDTTHIQMTIETAHIKLADYLQAWQRIWYAQFLGNYKSAHTLSVRYRLNYEQQWSNPFLLDVDSNYNATTYGQGPYGAGPFGSTGSLVYQRSIHLNRDCQAIAFQIRDEEQAADYGPAFELTELVLTGGFKRGTFKLDPSRAT